jgi:uncharacterized protein (DUF2267 family)
MDARAAGTWRRDGEPFEGGTMTYDEFIKHVRDRTGLEREQAEAVTRATLETLAERLTGGEADDLAAQLPKALQEPLLSRADEGAERFDIEEFKRRVAERSGISPAADAIRAVMTTIREAVTRGEFDDVMQQLPDEFWALVEPVRAGGATTR